MPAAARQAELLQRRPVQGKVPQHYCIAYNSHSVMTLNSSTRLGHYEVLTLLGAGGMGEVYRAHDAKLGRDVALKVVREVFAGDAERMVRFRREAKILASLNHPNIAAIHGLEDASGTPALVMEFVDGPTLADRILQGPIPVDESISIAKQICEALEYAHERGIVHRDLKPANVKAANEDTVKVLDFGLAKAMEGKASSPVSSQSSTISRMETELGILLGTPAYMSPEQAKGKFVDHRVDIWAFGCVFYEMLTGKQTFTGETVTDTLAAVITKEPDWSRLPPATPARVRVLLQRCLQKDPKQRLRDVGDARISLDEVLAGASDPLPGIVVPAAVPLWRRALSWAMLAMSVAALSAAILLHFRQRPAAPKTVRFQIPAPENTTIGAAGAFALSPDGRQLAFFAVGSDRIWRLWIRSLDSLVARPLQGGESTGANPPPFAWSPDSRYIAFESANTLRKIPADGGPAQTLCDGFAVAGSWNRDGVIIFGDETANVLMRVAASGGPPSAVTALDPSRGEIRHAFPWFLPDGKHFLYLRLSSQPEASGVYVGSLDTAPRDHETRRLLATEGQTIYVPSSNPDMGQLLFLRDATLLAQTFDARRLELSGEPVKIAEPVGTYRYFGFFSAGNNALAYRMGGGSGDFQLTWFDREGKVFGKMGEPGNYSNATFSPNGVRAAIGLHDPQTGHWSIWLFDLSKGTSARFTFGARNARFPVWSPDGNRIIFSSVSNGIAALYQKPANGTKEEELLLKSDENLSPTSISRDGRFLLYTSMGLKRLSLGVLPLNGTGKPLAFAQTPFNEWDGHFSPDGHWIAYKSDESGQYEVYVRPFSPDSVTAHSVAGGKWQISYGGGIRPRWSADGKELYYLAPDGKVMVVAVVTRPVFHAGTPRPLFQAPAQPGRELGDYTVDGRRFLFPVPLGPNAQPPFTVVLNWQEELNK
ncbi:MAG TPA: protein kinase [Terriglobales bacterium]|nr:protein kinase [Terriglobales bacterium]